MAPTPTSPDPLKVGSILRGCSHCGVPMKKLMCLGVIVAMTIVVAGRHAAAQTAPASGGPVDRALIEDLVAASHILAQEGVLDAFGHVSVRHPNNSVRYLMSRSVPPALMTADDVIEYDLDSNPVNGNGRASFLEAIHSRRKLQGSSRCQRYRA